jgi:hypothetical protein
MAPVVLGYDVAAGPARRAAARPHPTGRPPRSTVLGGRIPFKELCEMSGAFLSTLTSVHVVLSLIGIGAGVGVALGMLSSKRLPRWTALFLATTILTSVTGFFFPFDGIKPSHVFGIISLPLLALAVLGLYVFRLAGRWRWIYVVTSLVALYLNAFVAVVQAFLKIPFLTPLAPTQSEPPFAVAQLVLLAAFVWLGYLAVRAFRPGGSPPTLGPAGA